MNCASSVERGIGSLCPFDADRPQIPEGSRHTLVLPQFLSRRIEERTWRHLSEVHQHCLVLPNLCHRLLSLFDVAHQQLKVVCDLREPVAPAITPVAWAVVGPQTTKGAKITANIAPTCLASMATPCQPASTPHRPVRKQSQRQSQLNFGFRTARPPKIQAHTKNRRHPPANQGMEASVVSSAPANAKKRHDEWEQKIRHPVGHRRKNKDERRNDKQHSDHPFISRR